VQYRGYFWRIQFKSIAMKTSSRNSNTIHEFDLVGHIWLDSVEWIDGKPPSYVPKTLRFVQKHLGLDLLPAQILCAVYARWKDESLLHEKDLKEVLSRNAERNPEPGMKWLDVLIEKGWVEVPRLTRSSGKLYAPSNGLLAFFRSGDPRFLEICVNSLGDRLLDECISWHKAGYREYGAHSPLNALVDFRNAPMVRYICRRERSIYCQSAILYLMGHEVSEASPLSTEDLLERLIPSHVARLVEGAAWQHPDAPAYRSGIIEPRAIVNNKVATVGLSAAFKKRFLPATLLQNINGQKQSQPSEHFQLILPEQIPSVKLRYNASFQFEMDTFLGLLSPQRLDAYFDLLRKRSMTPALSVMLSGAPGTGKTELVRQLARKHKRVLIQVNLQGLREMWFGESEKNVTRLFSEIQAVRKNLAKEPIILFNEADGFFHSRQPAKSSSGQTETAIITLFLQFLEQFEGVVFATSNHTHSMDPAFERRWSIKLPVPQPDEQLREHLLRDRFRGLLPAKDLTGLAKSHPYSPAQLDNVLRKFLLLGPENRNRTMLQNLIAQEMIGWKTIIPPVGF
jgi:hypothetical protein